MLILFLIKLQIDFPIICSLLLSARYKISSKKLSSLIDSVKLNFLAQFIRSFTSGFPEVNVPVLSNTIVLIFYIFSNT